MFFVLLAQRRDFLLSPQYRGVDGWGASLAERRGSRAAPLRHMATAEPCAAGHAGIYN